MVAVAPKVKEAAPKHVRTILSANAKAVVPKPTVTATKVRAKNTVRFAEVAEAMLTVPKALVAPKANASAPTLGLEPAKTLEKANAQRNVPTTPTALRLAVAVNTLATASPRNASSPWTNVQQVAAAIRTAPPTSAALESFALSTATTVTERVVSLKKELAQQLVATTRNASAKVAAPSSYVTHSSTSALPVYRSYVHPHAKMMRSAKPNHVALQHIASPIRPTQQQGIAVSAQMDNALTSAPVHHNATPKAAPRSSIATETRESVLRSKKSFVRHNVLQTVTAKPAFAANEQHASRVLAVQQEAAN